MYALQLSEEDAAGAHTRQRVAAAMAVPYASMSSIAINAHRHSWHYIPARSPHQDYAFAGLRQHSQAQASSPGGPEASKALETAVGPAHLHVSAVAAGEHVWKQHVTCVIAVFAHTNNPQHKLFVFMQTKLPLHFARRNATWLLTQLAHLLLQEDSPEQSGI